MHGEPTTRKLLLRTARSAQGSLSHARCLLPGQGHYAACARGAEAPAGGTRDRRGGRSGRCRSRGAGACSAGRGPRGDSPVGTRGAASSRGTCGQAGWARTAQSLRGRVRPPARGPVPLRLPEQAQSPSLRTKLGDTSSAGCPRQAPTPFPGRLPLDTLFPSPLPPTPLGMENTSRVGGGGGTPLGRAAYRDQ